MDVKDQQPSGGPLDHHRQKYSPSGSVSSSNAEADSDDDTDSAMQRKDQSRAVSDSHVKDHPGSRPYNGGNNNKAGPSRPPPAAIKGEDPVGQSRRDSRGSKEVEEEEGWIMTDEELQAMLTRHRARGRGGVGSRADDVGPFLPEGYEETR